MTAQTILTKHISRPDVAKLQPCTPRDRSAALEDVIRHFAAVCGRSPEDVRQEIAQIGGNMVVTDKEAKAIFAYLEDQYHRDDLFSPIDLCPVPAADGSTSPAKPSAGQGGCVDPAQDTSVCALVDIIAGKLGF